MSIHHPTLRKLLAVAAANAQASGATTGGGGPANAPATRPCLFNGTSRGESREGRSSLRIGCT